MALRPESSVSCERDAYGELVFAGDRPGPVVSRTPEELGIPRVVAAAPGRRVESDVPAARREAARIHREVEKRAAGEVKRDALERKRVQRRETTVCRVRQDAQPDLKRALGEMAAAPQQMQAGGDMAGKQTAENAALRDKVLAQPKVPAGELAQRYGVPIQRVYDWRYEARKAERPPGMRARVERVVAALGAAPVAAAEPDAPRMAFRIELTQGEITALMGKLSPDQRLAFVAAGIKALLS